jgi:hypothetical protein
VKYAIKASYDVTALCAILGSTLVTNLSAVKYAIKVLYSVEIL